MNNKKNCDLVLTAINGSYVNYLVVTLQDNKMK